MGSRCFDRLSTNGGEGLMRSGPKVARDGGVVARHVLEAFLGELAGVLEGRILLWPPLDSFGVVRGVDEDQDRGEVLGGGAQDRGSADIDVLERVFERDARFGGCLAKV